jgi:hypothetical protein
MTDETESKLRAWATKRNGDPLTPKDVVELVLAADDDWNQRDRRRSHEMAELKSAFDDHCISAGSRIEAITINCEQRRHETDRLIREACRFAVEQAFKNRPESHETWLMKIIAHRVGSLLFIVVNAIVVALVAWGMTALQLATSKP